MELNSFEKLKKDMENYRKNRAALSDEQLNGRYHASWTAFLKQCRNDMYQYLKDLYISMFRFDRSDTSEILKFCEHVYQAVDEEKENQSFGPVFQTMFSTEDDVEYALDRALGLAFEHPIYKAITWDYENTYWPTKCYVTEDGRIYNSILRMYWSEKTSDWERHDGDYVSFFVGHGCPQELIYQIHAGLPVGKTEETHVIPAIG